MPSPASQQFRFRSTIALFLIAFSFSALQAQTPPLKTFDVVIYGGTSAGVIAAVEVAKSGRSVAIVGPDKHLGGLSSGGLGWTDTGNKAVIGGLARSEFYHRIWQHYQDSANWKWQTASEYGNKGQGTAAIDGQQRTMWIFEPHAAEKVFEDLVKEYQIPVFRDRWLDRENGVKVREHQIQSIRMLDGSQFAAQVFIDATYEGDLMASAGVSYHVGREANSVYDETWNGVQVGVLHHKHWFSSKISPYQVPGDPRSGLVAGVSDTPPGEYGQGDARIQAYCYRMCLTNANENRIPFPKPPGYNPANYVLLQRVLENEWREVFNKFDPIPNRKTDTNNHGPFSTDFIGQNYDYPEATYERRAEILEEHRRYQQGLMYYLANDPQVPADVQAKFAKWGLAADEFLDNGGWPHQIYVREARRMLGSYVMTEHDCLGKRTTPKPVGMGSYTLDSHNVQRYITDEGYVQNEGDIGVHVPAPYQVSYDSLVPRKEECSNLLVPVCISSSHIAFGSIRMEPVFMILGHSAAAAADLAIELKVPVQDVPYERLAQRLRDEGQILDLQQSSRALTSRFPGIVVDDSAAELTGEWTSSSANAPYVGFGYRHDGNSSKGEASAVFAAELEKANYEVRLAFPTNRNRATNTQVTLSHRGGEIIKLVNQREPSGLVENQWYSVGTYKLAGPVRVTISNADSNGYVIIDAVQFLPQR